MRLSSYFAVDGLLRARVASASCLLRVCAGVTPEVIMNAVCNYCAITLITCLQCLSFRVFILVSLSVSEFH